MAVLIDRVRRYARTVAHLRPEQIAHRIRLRIQRVALPVVPDRLLTRGLRTSAPGWPEAFTSVDRRVPSGSQRPEANAEGRFEFFGIERDVSVAGWQPAGTPRLWRYHLHYFECVWSFMAHTDRAWASPAFGSIVGQWRAANPIWTGDPWHPYVASLRAWALCDGHGSLARGTAHEAAYVELLDLHRRHLRLHLELDVGGNHLLKNLKALIGLAVFFDDEDLLASTHARLERELGVQILADGGHYELSPSYHCQVLGDLLDVRGLLEARDRALPRGIDDAIARMRTWLGWMLLPDGDVPLFNDCVLVGRNRIAVLEPTMPPAPASGECHLLAASGYAVLRHSNGIHAVMDVGMPCPPNLPAHAHADCLSIQVNVGEQRVIVDTGTSTYEAGERREYERSTAAHSTVEIDGKNQSEVYGLFRAGRLARPTVLQVDDLSIEATHDGYNGHLPVAHVRRLAWRDDVLVITDDVHAPHTKVTSRLLAYSAEARSGRAVVVGDVELRAVDNHADFAIEPTYVATDFGAFVEAACLSRSVACDDRISMGTEVRI